MPPPPLQEEGQVCGGGLPPQVVVLGDQVGSVQAPGQYYYVGGELDRAVVLPPRH